MIHFVLGILAFILIGFAAKANPQSNDGKRLQKDCTELDLSRPLGPNRSQGDIGWCYANTTADLLTYHYQDELKGQRVSAGYVALAYNNLFFQDSSFEGGFIFLAIKAAIKEGICPVSTEESLLKQGPQVSLKKKLSGLRFLKKHFDQTGGESLHEDLQKYYLTTRSVLTQIPRSDLVELLENSKPAQFPKKFADYVCHDKKIHFSKQAGVRFDLKYFHLLNTTPLLKKLHTQLDQNNIVGIDYFSDFFESDDAPNTNSGRHVSVVTGRRWNEQERRCELKLRNSWGSSCHGYTAQSLQKPGVCVQGNIWISEDVLLKRIYGLSYILKN